MNHESSQINVPAGHVYCYIIVRCTTYLWYMIDITIDSLYNTVLEHKWYTLA